MEKKKGRKKGFTTQEVMNALKVSLARKLNKPWTSITDDEARWYVISANEIIKITSSKCEE